MTNIYQGGIVILDFGSQYTQLIGRRIREMGVFCEIEPFDCDVEAIKRHHPAGVILSGGPNSAHGESAPKAPNEIFEMGIPVLGICYGMQTMTQQLGGQVESAELCEYGHANVTLTTGSTLFADIKDTLNDEDQAQLTVWMSHGDHVSQLAEGFVGVAQTEDIPFAAIANEEKHFYGVQFHPEVTHTLQGKRILQRFVLDICQSQANWTPANIVSDAVAMVQKKVAKDAVILGLSGGVDSSVVAALLHKAIGSQLLCIFIDTGLLRLHESDEVMRVMQEQGKVQVKRVDASSKFLTALQGVSDPEDKRRVIGEVFIRVFEEEALQYQNAKWLAQGTIYPDVIESAKSVSGKAQVIKSHHNVGGLPEKMSLELIEPLRDLFKDEVRKLGLELGLPYDMVYRHPFPGPGLALRILGEVTVEKVAILQQVDAIFIGALREADLYHQVSQAFAVFLPVKSVGVKGDQRCYEYVIALRSVDSVDFMTAHWSRLPYEFLAKVSHDIINQVSSVSRVVYDISGKPPATIEWE